MLASHPSASVAPASQPAVARVSRPALIRLLHGKINATFVH